MRNKIFEGCQKLLMGSIYIYIYIYIDAIIVHHRNLDHNSKTKKSLIKEKLIFIKMTIQRKNWITISQYILFPHQIQMLNSEFSILLN